MLTQVKKNVYGAAKIQWIDPISSKKYRRIDQYSSKKYTDEIHYEPPEVYLPISLRTIILFRATYVAWLETVASVHWENCTSNFLHFEWNMIVVTVFFSILNQMEFNLVQNRKENCHHDHTPFNVKGIGSTVFSVWKVLWFVHHETSVCIIRVYTFHAFIHNKCTYTCFYPLLGPEFLGL